MLVLLIKHVQGDSEWSQELFCGTETARKCKWSYLSRNTPLPWISYFYVLFHLWTFQISYNYKSLFTLMNFIGWNVKSVPIIEDSKYPNVLRFSRKKSRKWFLEGLVFHSALKYLRYLLLLSRQFERSHLS